MHELQQQNQEIKGFLSSEENIYIVLNLKYISLMKDIMMFQLFFSIKLHLVYQIILETKSLLYVKKTINKNTKTRKYVQ